MSHPIPTEDYTEYATEKQLAFVWNHFRDFANHGRMCDKSTDEAKKEMLSYFGADRVSDITKEAARDYINEIPNHERMYFGGVVDCFRRDWL
jgi:hypothetical protein